ncbi:MAG: SDR family oxidoreductase [Thermoanaerobaculia bacterium]
MILVTGASGNIGTELLRELSKRGEKFRAAYTSKDKAEKARSASVEPAVADFARPDTLASALVGIDRLFLLSPNPPSEFPVVRAAKSAGVKHILKLSVIDAPGEGYAFGKMHRAVEKEIEASGMDFTFLRPNGFMQNLANQQAAAIKSQGAFYFPAADTRISHVDVRDIARVAATVLTSSGHSGKAYELTGPEALTYADMAATLARVLGKPVKYVAISDDDFRKALGGSGTPAPVVEALVDLFAFYKRGGAARISGDIEKVTGRKATSFEDYARENASAFR